MESHEHNAKEAWQSQELFVCWLGLTGVRRRRFSMGSVNPNPFRLVIEPMCGLCNRLRVIDGASSLVEEKGGKLEFIWFCDSDLNCRFEDLFEPLPKDVKVRNVSLPRGLQLPVKRVLHAWMKRTTGQFFEALEVESRVRAGFDFAELMQSRSAFLRTWDRIRPSVRPFARFRPVKKIQAMIDLQAGELTEAIGVHIRRTDNVWSRTNSSTENFVARMQTELELRPDARFFISTDDADEETYMRNTFPGRVFSYTKRSRSRNERVGIEDAVVDLYSLGSCRKILGSHLSSFSETAEALSQLRQPREFAGVGASPR